MATTIVTKNSTTATSVPTTGDIIQGELAVNLTDGYIFSRDEANNIVQFGVVKQGASSGYTTRFDGTNWVHSSALTNDGTNVAMTGTVTGPSGTWDAGGMDLATTDTYAIAGTDVLSATTLGANVVNSSLTNLGLVTTFESTGIDDNATSTAITIDSSDRVSIGTTDVSDFLTGAMIEDGLEIQSDTAAMASIYQYQYNASDSADLSFYRARGTKASPTAVASGDVLGQVWGGGHDGTDWHPAADMRFIVDGTPADDPTDMPGRVQFHTCADGSVALTEAMRISNDNKVSINTTDDPLYSTLKMDGGVNITASGDAWRAHMYLAGYEDSATSQGEVFFTRARGTAASPSVSQNGDALGRFAWAGRDSAGWEDAAKIGVLVDGVPNDDVTDMPGRIAFYTTPDGSDQVSERLRIDNAGNVLIGTSTAGASKLVVNDDSIQINTAKTPASATDTGTTGQVAWDSSYIYVCIGTNVWRRAAISGGW